MTTASTAPSPVLFPAFLYGDYTTVRRKMKAEAKKWAKRYAEKGDFPEPVLAPVPPGSVLIWERNALDVMWWGHSPDNDPEWAKVAATAGPKAPRWHFYMVENLRLETLSTFDADQCQLDQCTASIELFLCRYPWGVLSVVMNHLLFNTIPVVTRRIEALLSFWDQLDTLCYIDASLKPLSLTEWVTLYYQGEVAMWVDQPTGNIRTDLRRAIDQMGRASEDEIRSRLMRQLHALIETEQELDHREWLRTPGVIERELESCASESREWFDNLTTGNKGTLGGFLSTLARDYPDG